MSQDIRLEYLQELEETSFFKDERTEGSLRQLIDYYGYGVGWVRFTFRAIGILLILLSASIPVLNALMPSDPKKDTWMTIIAGSITVLTSLTVFFRWEYRWRSKSLTRNALLRQKTEWESKRVQGLKDPDPNVGLKILQEAQERLIKNVYLIIEGEMNEFFKAQTQTEKKDK